MLPYLGVLFASLFSSQLMAAQCSAVYAGAAQSNGNGGTLTINSDGQILNSPSTQLAFDNGTINGNGSSCGSADCSVTGNNAAGFSLPSYPSDGVLSGGSYSFSSNQILGQGSYNSDAFSFINVNDGTTSFSNNYSTYYIRSLAINNTAKVNFKPGIYWIKTLNLNSDAQINVTGSGTVKIYAQEVNLNSNAIVNGVEGSANLLLTVYNNMHANSNAQAEGVFYVANTLTVDSNASITGAVSALNLTVNSNGTVNYNSGFVAQTDFNGLCTSSGSGAIATFAMEQTAWGGSGSVLDTSGNNNNATPVGNVSPEYIDPQISCKAASIPANTSYLIDAINTDVDINTLGDQGSVALWYRSNQDWDQLGTSKVLLDATQANNAEFTLFHSQSQRLFFFISEADGDTAIYSTDNTFNFGSADWVHITVTWDADNDDVRIYVNGTSQSLFEQAGVALDEGLANIDTLYVGDNRSTSNIVSTGYSADGYIDEVHMFDYQLTSTQVNTVRNDTSTCTIPPPQAVAHYKLEQSDWPGSNSIIDSSANNNHASPIGVINSLLPQPQASCRAVEIPQNTSSQSHAIDTELDVNTALGNSGSISFWFNSKQNWGAGDNKKLFDASTENNNVTQAHAFYATLTSNGSIEFGYETDNDLDLVRRTSSLSFSANEWVHLSFTWDVVTEAMQIYVNGVSQSLTDVVNENTSNNLADLTTLYIGDNRSNYSTFFTNTNNSADGKFDEIYLHNFVLNNSQVSTIKDATTPCNNNQELLFLKLEETSWSGNDSIIDSSGNNNHSSPVGNILPILPDSQIACRAANMVANNDTATINAIDTELDVNTHIGDQGTISFWYQTDTAWNTGNNNKQLLDASSASRYFYATLLTDGRIEFAIQDSSGNQRRIQTSATNISADTWGYLSLSWNTSNGDLRVYLDGTLLTHTDLNNDNLTGGLADLETLYIGDNRGNFLAHNSSGYSADGYVDEVRVFNYVLSAAEIASNKADVGFCGQYAFYQFEQPSWENANSVLDSWAAMRHASALGLVSSIFPDQQKSCLALDVPFNNSTSVVDAIDTQIDMNDIGPTGTVSFWYRSDQNWVGGGSRLLLDASDSDNNRRFFLRLNNNGSLRFVLNRNSGNNMGTSSGVFNFSANQWVHIAISWDMITNNRMQIFVNGAVVQTRTHNTLTVDLGNVLTLYIGDNRGWRNFGANSANGQFDSVRLYDLAQSAAEVTTDMAIVNSCSRDLAHYMFEENTWNGMNTILDSFSLGNHATPRGNISPVLLANDIACQAMRVPDNSQNSVFDAADTEIDVNDEIGAYGTISFWYQSRQGWQGAGHDKILFDASVSPSQRFYLLLKSYGALQLNVSRSDGSLVTWESNNSFNFSANTWVHVAISWDAYNDNIQMFIDSVSQSVANTNNTALDAGLADFNSIYMGDNRGASFVSATGYSADGYFDDVRIYGYVQSQSQISTDYADTQDCSVQNLHHYELTFSNTASTCDSLPVNVKACADASCSTVYANSSQVDMIYTEGASSPVTFADDLVIPANSDSGVNVDLTFTQAKTLVLGIANPVPVATDSLVCSAANCEVVFSEGLSLQWQYGATNTISTQISQKDFAESLKVVPLAACGNLPANTPLEIAVECVSPTSCSSVAGSTFTLGSTSISENNLNNVTNFTQVDPSFDKTNGEMLDTAVYNDAGQIRLHAKVGDVVLSSNSFVVHPAYLELLSTSNVDLGVGQGDTSAKTFTVSLQAKGYKGLVTPNYQPADVEASFLRTIPAGNVGEFAALNLSNNGSVNIISASTEIYADVSSSLLNFNQGVSANLSAKFSEVGTYTLNFRENSYQGSSFDTSASVDTSVSGNGLVDYARPIRFKPAYFDAVENSPVLDNSCKPVGSIEANQFSYLGQVLSYETSPEVVITARNHDGGITKNYSASLWTLSPTVNDDLAISDLSSYSGTIGTNQTLTADGQINAYDGIGKYVLTAASITYNKDLNIAHTPFDANIRIEYQDSFFKDSDNICYNTDYANNPNDCESVQQDFNAKAKLRYGRIALLNAVGNAETELPVPIQVQYFAAGGFWAVNTLDTACTSYNSVQATVTDEGLGAPLPTVNDTSGDKDFVAGQPLFPSDGIVLSAPNRNGAVKVTYTIPVAFEHLKVGSSEPSAIVTFGQYRGNDRIIHWREVFNE